MAWIFEDENHTCRFDFSEAQWATDQLNAIFHAAKVELSDVDFLVETKDELVFLEYKNASHPSVAHGERFDVKKDKFSQTLCRKFYGSSYFTMATGKGIGKKKKYVLILEFPNADPVTRKYLRNRVAAKLPFKLQEQNKMTEKLIDSVDVVSLKEWNQKYPQFQGVFL